MSRELIIKLKSDRSKCAIKKPKKKKAAASKLERRQSSLSRLLDAKLSQWHDDEYDAGKDW